MPKFITKLYLYDSTKEDELYKGTDYSKYIMLGGTDTDNLDDTIDSVDLTLIGLPFEEEFEPETRFILEKYEEQTKEDGTKFNNLWKSWDLCVNKDVVSKPIISNNHYFNHEINFTDASIVAQRRVVDNIAVTYRLKDVSLESSPTYDTEAKAIKNIINVTNESSENFGEQSSFLWKAKITGHQFKWVMPDWYKVEINGELKTPSWDDWNNFKLNQEIPSSQTATNISLPIPMLECSSSIEGTKSFRHNGYCSIIVKVQETQLYTNETKEIVNMEVNPATDTLEENWTCDAMASHISGYGWIESRLFADSGGSSSPSFFSVLSKVSEAVSEKQNRVLNFTIKNGCSYKISIFRKVFTPTSAAGSGYTIPMFFSFSQLYDKYPAYYNKSQYWNYIITATFSNEPNYTNENYPLATLSFNAVLAGTNQSLYLRNAPTENAYNLFNKAQIASQNIKKVLGIPVDETPKTFYVDEADKQELKNTTIIENFYNQKNLYEIFMDIGKYTHSKPIIKFGTANRFLLTFKKYGQTDQHIDNANTISVYNSRFVEEYISAISSYVTNMVQLGGYITEIVAPKSSSSDYLVYNDVAEIHTQENIIELVDLNIIRKTDNEKRNLVGKGTHGESNNGYVFEESVYNLLSANANDSVNKGLAIYYVLGTNKIIGLNYQLPSINTGDSDTEYTIKRIIGSVYQMVQAEWKNIKVNDFLFEIKYRTKGTLRTNQTRPDLRKYILSAPYDRVPQHIQFNNQTDTVVDSVKFGNNTYGSLIRTGNTIYTKVEWVNSLFDIKQSGELYNINGNLYYVSKVKNTYYKNHVISMVEFSKDFNRLSQIIGIPSEPRFYEISERSQITRQISLDDYIVLGTSIKTENNENSYIRNAGWEYIASLLLNSQEEFPKYAITIFKNDVEKETIFGNETFKTETCHPVSAYSVENTLTLKWDMKDNFSAGDQISSTTLAKEPSRNIDTAYNTLIPFRYPDVYGRADMVDFAIISEYSPNSEEVMNLPKNPINVIENQNKYLFGNEDAYNLGSNKNGLILLKDNREVIHLNYNLQLITDSDRFVLSSYIWQPDKKEVKLALLKEEVNKISSGTISNKDFDVVDIELKYKTYTNKNYIEIDIKESLKNYDLSDIKAIVIYSNKEINDYSDSGAKYFVMARNVSDLSNEEKSANWYIGNYSKDMFKSQ